MVQVEEAGDLILYGWRREALIGLLEPGSVERGCLRAAASWRDGLTSTSKLTPLGVRKHMPCWPRPEQAQTREVHKEKGLGKLQSRCSHCFSLL